MLASLLTQLFCVNDFIFRINSLFDIIIGYIEQISAHSILPITKLTILTSFV
jgi:hypothetical protein